MPMEMKRVAMVPQQVHVSIAPTLMFEIINTLDQAARVGSGSVSLLGRKAQRMLVACALSVDGQRDQVLKEMHLYPPDRITYRHLSGPFIGALEALRLRPALGGTDLVLTAEFDAVPGRPHQLLKLSLEQAAQNHLLSLKEAAERHARPPGVYGAGASQFVPLPALTNEHALIAAVEAQEEAEWGHVGHGRGVERVAVSLAEAAMLPARQLEPLRRAALLHDVGKVGLDSTLWGKRGILSPQQRILMEAHPRLGHDLAARAGLPEPVLVGILHHHERWDGQGYPNQLVGEAIPLKARILFLAEAIDSMLRATYRRQTMTTDQVVATLQMGAGRLWDPILARKAARIIRGR